MRINFVAYYYDFDGYGRYNSRVLKALRDVGYDVKAMTSEHLHRPAWMLQEEDINLQDFTISSLPPGKVERVPGRHWLMTMWEGSVIGEDLVQHLNESNLEKIILPCQHNLDVFKKHGVTVPMTVIPGGTDPEEFPVHNVYREDVSAEKPYVFLTWADRGHRKGWNEVWDAFYLAFGGKTTGIQDVRLIIKYRLHEKQKSNLTLMTNAEGADKRIIYQTKTVSKMQDVYSQADCVVIPSRSEGWGMPHREAACMGIPVIVQKYSGLDDGFTEEWANVVEGGKIQSVGGESEVSEGEWMVADKHALANLMLHCYNHPKDYKTKALKGAAWIRNNQTWMDTAVKLKDMLEAEDGNDMERSALPVLVRTA